MSDVLLPVGAHTICVSGRDLTLAPLTVGQLVEVERRILSEMRDPLQAIAARWEDFNDAQRRQLLEAAFAHHSRAPTVSLADIVTWMNSPRGTAYACWLAARVFEPRLDWEVCERLVLAAPPDVLEAIQRVLAPEWWEDLLGKLTWPDSTGRGRGAWSSLYRELSLAFGWTPREIGALTLAELAIYLEPGNEKASRWLDAEEARRRVVDRHQQRANWVHDVWEMIEHGLSTT